MTWLTHLSFYPDRWLAPSQNHATQAHACPKVAGGVADPYPSPEDPRNSVDRWVGVSVDQPESVEVEDGSPRQVRPSSDRHTSRCNVSFYRRSWVLLMLILIVGISSIGLTGCQSGSARMRWGEEQKLLAAAWTYVDRAYVDPTFNQQDWWKVRQQALAQPLPDRATTYHQIDLMLGSLGDPFTRFLDPEHFTSLQTSTAGELSGVGLQIAIDDEDQVIVIAPIEGTPADQAGLASGDQILAIDDQPTGGLNLDTVAEKMRGPTGTPVHLTIQRQEQVFGITLIRAGIAINPVRTKIIPHAVDHRPVAYLRLSQFNGNAAEQIQMAIREAEQEGVAGYVLDLRNNTGGLLQAAIEIGQMWLAGGDLVLVTNRNGIQDSIKANSEVLTEAPLVVLVNRGSASASEVLAGALQDRRRAVLVGTRTFGKGLIQSLFELPDGSGLAVTTAKYLTPNGYDINQAGIEPDVVAEMDPNVGALNYEMVGTEVDTQFMAALRVVQEQLDRLQTKPKVTVELAFQSAPEMTETSGTSDPSDTLDPSDLANTPEQVKLSTQP